MISFTIIVKTIWLLQFIIIYINSQNTYDFDYLADNRNYSCDEIIKWIGTEKHYSSNFKKESLFHLIKNQEKCNNKNKNNAGYTNIRLPLLLPNVSFEFANGGGGSGVVNKGNHKFTFFVKNPKTHQCKIKDKKVVIYLSNYSINNNYSHFLHGLLRLFCSLIDAHWILWDTHQQAFIHTTSYTIWLDEYFKLNDNKAIWLQALSSSYSYVNPHNVLEGLDMMNNQWMMKDSTKQSSSSDSSSSNSIYQSNVSKKKNKITNTNKNPPHPPHHYHIPGIRQLGIDMMTIQSATGSSSSTSHHKECITANELLYGSGCVRLYAPEKWYGYPACRAAAMAPAFGHYFRQVFNVSNVLDKVYYMENDRVEISSLQSRSSSDSNSDSVNSNDSRSSDSSSNSNSGNNSSNSSSTNDSSSSDRNNNNNNSNSNNNSDSNDNRTTTTTTTTTTTNQQKQPPQQQQQRSHHMKNQLNIQFVVRALGGDDKTGRRDVSNLGDIQNAIFQHKSFNPYDSASSSSSSDNHYSTSSGSSNSISSSSSLLSSPSLIIRNISFEALSPLETIQAMANTHLFISVHGAALTNQFFMKANTAVIEIIPYPLCDCVSPDYFYGDGGYYHGMSLALNIKHFTYCVPKIDTSYHHLPKHIDDFDPPYNHHSSSSSSISSNNNTINNSNNNNSNNKNNDNNGNNYSMRCSWKYLHSVKSVALNKNRFIPLVRKVQRELIAAGTIVLSSSPIINVNPHING